MNLIVIGKNVVICETEVEKESVGGIILTGSNTSGHKPAKVTHVGRDCEHVAVGVSVFLDWTKVMPIEVNGVKSGIVDESEIKAILD